MLNRVGEAIVDFTECVRLSTGRAAAIAYVRRGISFFRDGKLDRALSDAEDAIQADGGFSEAHALTAC